MFRSGGITFDEDLAGNPVHLVFIIAVLLLLAARHPKEQEASLYILSLLLGFLLFCAYLKWQPWHSRLHLPLFALFAPLIGLTFSRIRNIHLANSSMALLIVLALPWMFYNTTRPILGEDSIFTSDRTELYFRKQPALTEPYIAASDFLSELGCSKIGLIIGDKRWEYPLWALMRARTTESIHLEHVEVRNESRRLYNENHVIELGLCAIFFVKPNPPETISIGNVVYERAWSSDPITIYMRGSSP